MGAFETVLEVGHGGEALFALDQPCLQGVCVWLHRPQTRHYGASYHAPMPELSFLVPDGLRAADLAIALAEEVDRQDAAGVVCARPLAEAADRIHVLLVDSAEEWSGDLPDLSRSIVVLLASPGADRFPDSFSLARRAGAMFHLNPAAVLDLRDRQFPAGHLPPGYVAAWDRVDPRAGLDVAVVGSDGGYFDWLSTLRLMHRGSVVLHERSRGMAPLVAGRHLFVGDAGSLDALSEGLLRDPRLLGEVRSQAIDFLREILPLGRPAAALIGAARGVVGRPLSVT